MGLMFWILMLLWFVFGLFWHFSPGVVGAYGPLGSTILLFLLFFLLGWKTFGSPVQ